MKTSSETNAATLVDTEAASGRLACLQQLVAAVSAVEEWHQQLFEQRAQVESRLRQLLTPLVDGTLPASPIEKRLATKPPEMWSQADRLNVGWRFECAAFLEWALQFRVEVPSFDQQAMPIVSGQRAHARLRSREELESMRAEAELWWSRAQTARPLYQVLTKPSSPLSKKKRDLLRAALDSPGLQLFGKPYDRLTFREASTAYSIAIERCKAIRWLLDGRPWDETKPDATDG